MHISPFISPCTQLTQDAIPLLIKLEKQCFVTSWEYQQFIKVFSQKHYYAFGIQTFQKILIGYIAFYLIQDELEIITIAVQPEMRQKGYGKQLLYSALQYGSTQGTSKAFLEVQKKNVPAIILYKNFGFLQSGIRHSYYTDNKEDALIYTRSLTIPLPKITMESSCIPL